MPERSFFESPSWFARYWVLLLIASLMVMSLYFFLSASQLFDRFQGRLTGLEDSDAMRIRHYNQQLESLQERMTVFVADSVETKLKTLEKNVDAGTVGTQEIKTLEELKGEVKLLESYSVGKRGNLTDSSRLDHARFQIIPGSQQNTASTGDLLYEVSRMKDLLYLGIASCGLVGVMIGGYWWQTGHRAKRLDNDKPRARLLVRKTEDDS